MRRAGAATLVHTKGGASTLIEYGTCGPWGHIAVADGKGNFIEAWPGGVRRVPESHYSHRVTADIDAGLSDAQRVEAVAWLEQQLREPYNYAAIAVFVLKTLRADIWLGPAYRRFAAWAQARRQTICSELWVNMLRHVDADLWPGQPSSEISPNAIGLTGQVLALFYRVG